MVQYLAGARYFSHLYNTQAGSGTHPASYLGFLWALVFEVKQLWYVAGYPLNLVPVLPYLH